MSKKMRRENLPKVIRAFIGMRARLQTKLNAELKEIRESTNPNERETRAQTLGYDIMSYWGMGIISLDEWHRCDVCLSIAAKPEYPLLPIRFSEAVLHTYQWSISTPIINSNTSVRSRRALYNAIRSTLNEHLCVLLANGYNDSDEHDDDSGYRDGLRRYIPQAVLAAYKFGVITAEECNKATEQSLALIGTPLTKFTMFFPLD